MYISSRVFLHNQGATQVRDLGSNQYKYMYTHIYTHMILYFTRIYVPIFLVRSCPNGQKYARGEYDALYLRNIPGCRSRVYTFTVDESVTILAGICMIGYQSSSMTTADLSGTVSIGGC